MKKVYAAFLAVALCMCTVTQAAESNSKKEVTIGYLPVLNPWLIPIVDKTFEKETGYKINWRQFDSGSNVILGMASGDVEMGYAGSSPTAAALSRGVEASVAWVMTTSQESLAVRNGTGILAPQDLAGKKLAVPFVSTAHFSTVFALKQFGIKPGAVTLLNMQPQQIAAAWERGDIDAAFVWDPVLSKILASGKVLITSEVVSSWGEPTFDGLLVNNDFAAKNPDFLSTFLKVLNDAYISYQTQQASWTVDSEPIRKISHFIGISPQDAVAGMSGMTYPTLKQQVSCQWLGCGKEGGVAHALASTSRFLKAQRSIDKLLPDYTVHVLAAPAQVLTGR